MLSLYYLSPLLIFLPSRHIKIAYLEYIENLWQQDWLECSLNTWKFLLTTGYCKFLISTSTLKLVFDVYMSCPNCTFLRKSLFKIWSFTSGVNESFCLLKIICCLKKHWVVLTRGYKFGYLELLHSHSIIFCSNLVT